MKKKCSKCNQIKDIKQFTFKNKAKNKISSNCKSCTRQMSKTHYYNNKQQYLERNKIACENNREFIKDIKKNAKCKICGEKDWRCLDFHHKDKEDKVIEVALLYLKNWKRSRMLEEIAKCDILCANCHRKEHVSI